MFHQERTIKIAFFFAFCSRSLGPNPASPALMARPQTDQSMKTRQAEGGPRPGPAPEKAGREIKPLPWVGGILAEPRGFFFPRGQFPPRPGHWP